MKIQILGPLEVMNAGVSVVPSAPKVRQVLAVLALNANRTVSTSRLVEELWGDRPPVSWATTLQTYIYQLRRWLSGVAGTTHSLETRPCGYRLAGPAEDLDVHEFERLIAVGTTHLHEGDPVAAAGALQQALLSWRDQPLLDLPTGSVLQSEVVRLNSMRQAALEASLDAELQLGHCQQVVAAITAELARDPNHEGMHGRLMVALYRCGRRSDALAVYQQIRERLAEELGLDPGPELQKIHRAVLDDTMEPCSPAAVPPSSTSRHLGSPPAQLPPNHELSGRETELAWFDHLLHTAPTSQPLVLSVIGAPGVGVSALCVHAAHRIRAEHPDAQFYADFASASNPSTILANFLRAAGVDPADIPDDLEGRRDTFRSWTATRRVLVVLDGVPSTAELHWLLPTGPSNVTIAASHRRLDGRHITGTIRLLPLTPAQSRQLLSKALGPMRLAQDPSNTDRLVALCGGYPTALWAAAVQLAARPHWGLARLVSKSTATGTTCPPVADGLDVLDSMRRRNHQLPCHVQQALASVVNLTDIVQLAEASTALGVDENTAEELLEELVEYQVAEIATSHADETPKNLGYRLLPWAALALLPAHQAVWPDHFAEPAIA